MSDDKNTAASRGRSSKLSLSDKLAILGVLVGVISVLVAIYFGYLSLKPFGGSAEVTPMSTGPATVVSVLPVSSQLAGSDPATLAPGSTALFEDDFENGLAKWTVVDDWGIRQDEAGNHFICATPEGQSYSFIFPRVETPDWQDYLLNVRVMILNPLGEGAFTIDVHRTIRPEINSYQFQITEPKINLFRFDPEPKKWRLLTNFVTQAPSPATWYAIQVQVGFGDFIRYFINQEQVIEYSDAKSFVAEGIIRLGASPNSNVCFDDVLVSAPQ